MATTATSASIQLFPSPVDNGNGDYLALLTLDGGKAPVPAQLTNINYCNVVVLDISGSMGQYVGRVTTQILPLVFEAQGFDPEDDINLVLFESRTELKTHKVKEFPTLPYRAKGGTTMSPVFEQLEKIFKGLSPGTHVRLLTISDGEVGDVDRTCKSASELFEKLERSWNLHIESTGIRLFTSTYGTPDAKALSSILQFHTGISSPSLIDIPYPTNSGANWTPYCTQTAETISQHFGAEANQAYVSLPSQVPNLQAKKIVLGSKADAASPNALFKQHPWSQPSLALSVDKNVQKMLFWVDKAKFDALSPTSLTLSDTLTVPITRLDASALTHDTYEGMIASRIDFYMMQIKLFRVVGTDLAVKKVKEMAAYFDQLEKHLYSSKDLTQGAVEDSTQLSSSLKERMAILYKTVKQANIRLGLKMNEIANMDATTNFNAAQAASFLRSTGSGAASRGLVRRAGTDLDFDSIVKEEVVAMAKNIASLEAKMTPEIESTFKSSFVSLATTMDGLRAVCELASTSLQGEPIEVQNIGVTESLLDTLSAFQILSYLNIVGVPVQSTVGDYPDPYRYNINVVFSGHYCSLSDLMSLHAIQEGDNTIQPTLQIPGDKDESGRIDNVVPLFESQDILNFLMDFAPQSLSLYSSVGMRRVLAHIWETPHATLSAALVKMMRVVVVEPSGVNVDILSQIYSALQIFNRQSPNRTHFAELYEAVKYIKDWKATEKEEATISLTDKENLHYTTTTLPSLPQIQSSLTQIMYPLIQTYKRKEIRMAGVELDITDDEFSTLLRSVYYNEVFNALRSEFRGKPNADKIRLGLLQNLIGFDNEWKPELNSLYESDGPFNPTVTPQPLSVGFLCSKTFKSAVYRTQRLNVLLAIPFFAKLFEAFDLAEGSEERQELIDSVLSDHPRLLSTPETYLALKKKADQVKLEAEMKRIVDGPQGGNDYWSDDEEEQWMDARDDGLEQPRVAEIQTLLKEYREEQRGVRDEIGNVVEMKWNEVFYNQELDEAAIEAAATNNKKNDNTTPTPTQLLQLYATLSAYTHSEPSERFPDGQWQPGDFDGKDWVKNITPRHLAAVDFPYNSPLTTSPYIQFLTTQTTKLYERRYDSTVHEKVTNATKQVYVDLVKELITTPNLASFTTHLASGLKSNHYSAQIKTYQDPELQPLWKQLIDKDVECPLRCEKLAIVILGHESNPEKTPVWNNGNILYNHQFQLAAKFFYDEGKRGEWIQICEEYATKRKQFLYRETDLMNRHSHHLSHPSYFGLGYDTLTAFKETVSKDEYEKYVKQHKDCCGLTPAQQKRAKISKNRNVGKAGVVDPRK